MNARALLTALPCQIRRAAEEDAFRAYMAECARLLTENTMRAVGYGSYIQVKYHELIRPQKLDTRSGEEIAADVLKRAGIEVIM